MASFDVAYNWMMDNEDSAREYATVPDTGGQAISGINSNSFPEEFAKINAIPQAQRGPAVEQFYQSEFWNTWFDQIASDDVAKRDFDAAVNMGSGTAVKILQVACNTFGTTAIDTDGQWGPTTLTRLNSLDAGLLVNHFIAARRAHYVDIVRAKPQYARFLSQWLERASK